MSRNLIVVILLGFIGLNGGVSRAKPMTLDGTPGTSAFRSAIDDRALPGDRTDPDTTWFGGIGADGLAVQDGTWDFSDGTLQGWTSVDMTDNTGIYFGQVTASSFASDPYTPMFTGEIGQLWCGMHEAEADTRDWVGGMGYGNRWRQSASSPYLTCAGQRQLTISYKMFNYSEPHYDYTYLYVLAYDNAAPPNLLQELEVARYTGTLGSRQSPFHPTMTVYNVPVSTAKVQIEWRFSSDPGWSDEDGVFQTQYGPFAVDDIAITIQGSPTVNYEFTSGAEGWTFAKDPGKGRYLSVTEESVYQPWLSDAGVDSCVLVGDVMDFVRADGVHPQGQYELALSPPFGRPGDELDAMRQVLLKTGTFYSNVTETQTYLRLGYRYYPYTTESNPIPHWSPRVGSEYFEGLYTTACETLSRAPSQWLPEEWDSLQMCVEVYNVGPDDASGAPLFDNLRIGITTLPDLGADFAAEPTSGFAPLSVQFTDLSVGAPSGWEWDLDGNGTIDATVQNPLWTYQQAGAFDVTLVATRGTERDTLTRTDYITTEALAANFGAAPTSGLVPLTVQFADSSIGLPTGWEWDFDGNGTVDATVPNPTFEYASPGTYDVSLTVIRNGHEDTLMKPDYITTEILAAGFTGEPRVGRAPLAVSFTDQSTGHPTAWAWDLDGDGSVDSAEPNPTFEYETAGSYDVTLIVTREATSDTLSQAAYIVALPDTWVVEADGSGDFPTIAAAVDVAIAGMAIELGDGVFTGVGNRDVVVDKAISIRSRSGDAASCILDCQGMGRGFSFRDVGAPGAALSGITITHGYSGSAGGGALCVRSSVAITDCRFVDNHISASQPSGPRRAPNQRSEANSQEGARTFGDTVGEPFFIGTLPFTASGSTCGYTNNYDESCPYPQSTAPDVVFKFVPTVSTIITADLCASTYDTKVYIYANWVGNVIACNDDYCNFQSQVSNVPLMAGNTYYIIVDGYGPDCGAYNLSVAEYLPSGGGGLAACSCPDVVVRDCLFLSNSTSADPGGGCACFASSLDIQGTTFAGNTGAIGGAGYVDATGSVTLTECTLSGNSNGVHVGDGSTLALDRTIIAFSTVGTAVGGPGTSIAAACCDAWGNVDGPGHLGPFIGQNGNIGTDPLFCDAQNGDFSLREDSPCIPENNPVCGQIGAWPLGCDLAAFAATPTLGQTPLSVHFSDQTEGDPDGWEWDFEDDGQVDATIRDPIHVYENPGIYSVHLKTYRGGTPQATVLKTNCVYALQGENIVVHPGTITAHGASPIPIQRVGVAPLGAVSIFIEFDPTKVSYAGLQSFVPGETFLGGVVGNRVSIQWFDETGGLDPIVPGVDPDTLFAVLFEAEAIQDTTQLSFDETQSVLGDRYGNPLPDVHWIDDPPMGTVTISVGAIVSGRVGYYWMDRAVPGAGLSMGTLDPEVSTDVQGEYAFPGYPPGDYVLQVEKNDDLGGINSLDAIKIVRHATGLEPLGDPHKLRAADVNLDGHINALDALKVVLAALDLQPLPAGNWAFEPDSVSLAPLDGDRHVDFVAMRMGDVNGDWVATRGEDIAQANRRMPMSSGTGQAVTLPGMVAGKAGTPLPTITLSLPDTTLDAQGGAAGLPLRVTNFSGIGAVSLRITFASDVLQYVNLVSNVPGVSFSTNLVGSEIRIEWYDPTGGSNPIMLGNGRLLTINVLPIGEGGESSPLVFGDQCALGDPEGDPITGVEYIDGLCRLSGPGAVEEGDDLVPNTLMLNSGRPNPFRPNTVLTYSLPQGAHVDLAVFDVKGGCVATLMDADQVAGVHQAAWDGRDDQGSQVSSGVYLARLQVGGQSRVLKLVRCR